MNYKKLDISFLYADLSEMRADETYWHKYFTNWARKTGDTKDNDKIYQSAASNQFCFIRDSVGSGLGFESGGVIATHYSKSIELPVYLLEYKGLQIILRNNFYDWKVSVNSPFPLVLPEDIIRTENEKINPIYCEGFSPEWVFGMYKENNQQFTLEIGSDYFLFTLIYFMKNQVKGFHHSWI